MRLWIDLTDLAAWRGPFTGIQQTVFNLASRYAGRDDVGFFIYDDVRRRFFSIDFPEVCRRLERPETGPRRGAVRAAQKVFDQLPPSVRSLVPPHASLRLRGLMEEALHLRPAAGAPVQMGPDAVVLLAGPTWHHRAMLPDLCRLKREAGFRLVAVMYDLVPIFYAHLFPDDLPRQYREHMVTLMSEASALFAISRATQADVQRFCADEGLPMPDTRVFRLGDTLAAVTPVAPESPPEPGAFILTVGLEGRKNALLLYQMFKLAAQERIPLPRLVIAGRPSWIKQDHEALMRLLTRDPDARDRIQVMTGLDDPRLTWLYQNCLFTMFPSLCEGWGLPVAESLRHGKLCLASSASSIPEVGGDLAEYASPYDPRGFLDLVQRYLDPQRLAAREAEIRARYRPHDWDAAFAGFDRTLRQTLGDQHY
jgi:hypothetical protein